ncbi:hydrolase related to 2-haloalkanoic acid dehalogenase [Pyrococcus sp. ST04]|nr:hydrolase related to 2-haloalkanoic acid dehalogenase [Pyrococcus sp. ST04]
MRIRAIFFDLDGTLVSEWPLVMTFLPIVYSEISKKIGVPKYKAREIFLREIENRKGTYEWHDWNFFFELFKLPFKFEDFLLRYPDRIEVFSGVPEVLDSLSRKYILGVITSGPKYQELKLALTNLRKYFDVIITRDHVKAVKPDPKIFIAALEKAGVEAGESLMVGDNLEQDVLGAKGVGMKAVWINPSNDNSYNIADFEIKSILELPRILEVIENEEDI